MILDGKLLFTGTSNGATGGITSTALADAPTTGTQTASNVIDLGIDDGIPNETGGGGGARDIGTGFQLKLLIQVVTAFAGGTSLQAQLSGAPDNGSGGIGSYTTMWTGEAVLTAALVAGAYLANVSVPRVVPGQVLPRFLRLQFITSGTMSAGAVIGTIVLDRFGQVTGTSGNISGYQAGITVAN